MNAKQSDQLVSDEGMNLRFDQLIDGEIRMPGGATIYTIILQYKYVGQIIEYMNAVMKKVERSLSGVIYW